MPVFYYTNRNLNSWCECVVDRVAMLVHDRKNLFQLFFFLIFSRSLEFDALVIIGMQSVWWLVLNCIAII